MGINAEESSRLLVELLVQVQISGKDAGLEGKVIIEAKRALMG